MAGEKTTLSVILPCRNEEESLEYCLDQIAETLDESRISGEIIVSDSSTDRSPDIAQKFGAILVRHGREGYGAAYLEGFKKANGEYLFLADADGTYDFREMPAFLDELKKGADLVIGNRFAKKIPSASMPWMNRCVGNPALSGLMRLLFGVHIKDSHCGMRAMSRQTANKLNLKATGMEFASEMIIKAAQSGLKISEIPIGYHPRRGKSKLKPLSDGWRHIRLMLISGPLNVFRTK